MRDVRVALLVLALAPAARAEDVATAGRTGEVAAPAPAPSMAHPVAGSADALESISTTMALILDLMKRQVEQQDVALALHRVELTTFLLVDANREIGAKQDERDGLEQQVTSMDMESRDLTTDLPKEGPETSPEELAQRKKMIARMEQETAETKERLKKLDLQLTELQNQIAGQRDEIARWQEVADTYFQRRKN